MRRLNNLKEVQRLNDQLVVLSKFLPRAANTAKPFFKLLKKQKGIGWNEECESHFQKLKEFLTSSPILTRPRPSKDLILYFAVLKHAII